MKQLVTFILNGATAQTTLDDTEVVRLKEAFGHAWNTGDQTLITITDQSGGMPMYINAAAVQMIRLEDAA